MPATPKTRQEEVYLRLRGDILGGAVRPGERLRFNDICAQYGVSVGVMREALSRLVEQGLVTVTHQSGYSVMSLSPQDLEDLTFARKAIEGLAIRHAVTLGDVTWESNVLAVHHRLAALPHAEATDEWAAVHREFHETLLAGCGNEHLTDVATQLRDSAEVYRRWSLAFADSTERDIPGEHKAIVDAVMAGDADLAAGRLEAHIALTTRLLLASSGLSWAATTPAAT